MAGKFGKLDINFNIEPLNKVMCEKVTCKYNLVESQGLLLCNLKHITISEEGICVMREDKPS